MGNVIPMPTAVAVGATHVSIAQTSDGWAVMAWKRKTGPQMVGKPVSYAKAASSARAYADRVGAVLDLPIEMRRIDVQRCENNELAVIEISAGEGSASILETFGPNERDDAVAFALRMLPHFAPCRLGGDRRMTLLKLERRDPLDLDAIRRDHPLPDVMAGSGVELTRRGNELMACCPFHQDRTPSFTIFDGGRRFHCFGCNVGGDVLDFVQRLHGVGLREAAEMLNGANVPSVPIVLPPAKDVPDRTDEALAIWNAAQPIRGTLAEAYLRWRGIDIALPDCLRFASLRYGKSGPEHPVMVAMVSDIDGNLQGIQRTYLAPDGKGKADVPKPKLCLGRVTGGAVRLTPPTRTLILAEGIEDALSLMQGLGQAAWATCGINNLGKVVLPISTENVVIGADNDEAGETAAKKASHIYADQGCRVKIFRPQIGFKDFNAELQGARG